MNCHIVICGAGGIGRAAALMLACNESMSPHIFIGDINPFILDHTIIWLNEGKTRDIEIEGFIMSKEGANYEMKEIFQKADVVLDCLPGSQAPRIAKLARDHKAHYANLTEYVTETEEIKEIGKNANVGFVLQTGLAPGFINVLACELYNEFKRNYNNDELENMKMRVGALPKNAVAPYFYAYTWSPIGVATEYVEDAIVVKNYQTEKIASLSETESIIINGEHFEDSYTSGGAADLPDAFSGKIRNLDYKTLRYPGHYAWVKENLSKLEDGPDKAKRLDRFMQSQIPMVQKDRVIIYAHLAGKDEQGTLRGIEKSYDIRPTKVGHKLLRAIQTTTASSLCEAAYFLIRRNPSGIILQSDIDPLEFLNGPYVSEIYGPYNDQK